MFLLFNFILNEFENLKTLHVRISPVKYISFKFQQFGFVVSNQSDRFLKLYSQSSFCEYIIL